MLSCDSLVALAKRSEFNWATSLQPIRAIVGGAKCVSCGKSAGVVTQDMFKRVINSSAFKSDAARLKKQLGLTELRMVTDSGSILL